MTTSPAARAPTRAENKPRMLGPPFVVHFARRECARCEARARVNHLFADLSPSQTCDVSRLPSYCCIWNILIKISFKISIVFWIDCVLDPHFFALDLTLYLRSGSKFLSQIRIRMSQIWIQLNNWIPYVNSNSIKKFEKILHQDLENYLG